MQSHMRWATQYAGNARRTSQISMDRICDEGLLRCATFNDKYEEGGEMASENHYGSRRQAIGFKMVARDGIEPPTPAFSGPRSTTELSGQLSHGARWVAVHSSGGMPIHLPLSLRGGARYVLGRISERDNCASIPSGATPLSLLSRLTSGASLAGERSRLPQENEW